MHPTPVFLPGESHGQRSLVGYNPKGCKESDTADRTERARARQCAAALRVGDGPHFSWGSDKTKTSESQLNHFFFSHRNFSKNFKFCVGV